MTEHPPEPTLVDCTDCPFSRVVHPNDDVLPADVLIEHGRETDHKLTLSPLDGDEAETTSIESRSGNR